MDYISHFADSEDFGLCTHSIPGRPVPEKSPDRTSTLGLMPELTVVVRPNDRPRDQVERPVLKYLMGQE
jgi:hypothetical protein